MKYRNKKILASLALGAVLLGGCKKNFLDINTNPNQATDLNITPKLIFPQAEVAVGARAASLNWGFLNNWMGYTGASGSYAIDLTETSYKVDFSFSDPIWQNHYNVLFDLNKVQSLALAQGDSVLAGASMILSVKLWQELVDLYGDLPYSKAFQPDVTRTPAYDKAKDIYLSLMANLDKAKSYLKGTPPSTLPSFATIDVIAKGDQAKWIRFANTLKLRLLIRTSEVNTFNVNSEISKMMDGTGALNTLKAGDDVLVNPGYSNDASKQSPFYANYGLTPTGAESNPITRANNYFVTLLRNTADPRLTAYFKPVGTAVVGVDYGRTAGNPTSGQSSSFGPGLVKSATQDQWIYPAFESLFLEAEADARGWVPGSNAQATYEAAVTDNFRFLGLSATAANTYLTTVPIAMWSNSGASALAKAKFIAYQKYIALAGIDPYESYCDLRRLNMLPNTGYLSVNPNRSGSLPVRLPYPQSEYTANAANVNAEGSINILTSKIFWQP